MHKDLKKYIATASVKFKKENQMHFLSSVPLIVKLNSNKFSGVDGRRCNMELDGRGLWLKSFLLDISRHLRAISSGVTSLAVLQMSHKDGGKTSSRNDFNHRTAGETTSEVAAQRLQRNVEQKLFQP